MEENSRNGMEDLKRINRKYIKIKEELKTKKEEAERLGRRVKYLEDDLKIADALIISKDRSGDTSGKEQIQQQREKTLEELKVAREKLIELKEDVEDLDKDINVVLEKLKENPELKRHIEECLAVRYNRENRDLKKSKGELEKKKEKEEKQVEKLEIIKKEIKEHTHLKNNIQGYLQASADIKKLENRLSKLDPKDQANSAEISNLKKEIKSKTDKQNKNKSLMLDYFKKRKLDISEKDIKELEDTIVLDKKGFVDLNKTVSSKEEATKKQIKKYEKEIKKLDKKIMINDKAIANIQKTNAVEVPSQGINKDESEEQLHEQVEDGKQPSEKVGEDEKIEEAPKEEPEEEPKKESRFKKWWNKFANKFMGNRKKLPEPRKEEEPTTKEEEPITTKAEAANSEKASEQNEFRNSLKYDIVQDMMDEVSKETKSKAKADIVTEKKEEER